MCLQQTIVPFLLAEMVKIITLIKMKLFDPQKGEKSKLMSEIQMHFTAVSNHSAKCLLHLFFFFIFVSVMCFRCDRADRGRPRVWTGEGGSVRSPSATWCHQTGQGPCCQMSWVQCHVLPSTDLLLRLQRVCLVCSQLKYFHQISHFLCYLMSHFTCFSPPQGS